MQKIHKGDTVQILLGKDRGKTGKVERVLAKEDRIFIGGVNLVKRHVKKQGQVEGGIIEIVKPINISNVSLVCPSCKKSTRVGIKITGTSKVRFCKKCGKDITK